MKKFEMTNETVKILGVTLRRIVAIADFGSVKIGDFGGFLEKEENLSQQGDALVCDDASISEDGDYIVFKNHWSSGRYFTWTKSNNMWAVGCFYGTGDELIEKAYIDSELSGRMYEKYVKFCQSLASD